jgi:hypothetical protein
MTLTNSWGACYMPESTRPKYSNTEASGQLSVTVSELAIKYTMSCTYILRGSQSMLASITVKISHDNARHFV